MWFKTMGYGAGLLLAGIAGCASAPGAPTAPLDAAAVLVSPLRTEEDRNEDPTRKPADLLHFAGVTPGMRALDLSAGGGYTTQLLALATGPTGHVWAQMEKPRPAFDKRLANNPQANVTPLVRSLEDPYPADAPKLDLATLVLSYHDIAYGPVDRKKMNRSVFAALKPGGHFVVVDHAARPGTGLADTKTLHRIDEATVRNEVEAAGFVLEEQGAFLRNAADPREQAFFDMKVPSDKFALRFVRPR